MKYKIKTKDCRLKVRAKATIGENIDEKELDRFSRLLLRGFLVPKAIKKNQIEYTGPVGISVYERLKKPITKHDFLLIMEQLVIVVQNLHRNSLHISSLNMNIRNIFINEATKEIHIIYLPLISGKTDGNLIQLFEDIVYLVKPDDPKDNDFASRFLYFLRDLKPFDIEKIEKFIVKEDHSVVKFLKSKNTNTSGFMTDKPQDYYEHYEKKDEESTALLSEDDATDLLVEDEATGLLSEEDEATGLLSTEDEATGLLFDNNASAHFPTLLRVLTGEIISINKPVFRLGKERSYVDYFVTNNVAVSRSHADIITRSGKYFIMDLNSKNCTYINGQRIPVQSEVEILDSDRITLGNEEFVFNI